MVMLVMQLSHIRCTPVGLLQHVGHRRLHNVGAHAVVLGMFLLPSSPIMPNRSSSADLLRTQALR